MTFHSPTGRNNQKGQNAITDLLFFFFFLIYSVSTCLPGPHVTLFSQQFSSAPPPSGAHFFLVTTLESVSVSVWLFKVDFQSYTLSLLSDRLPHRFSMWHTLASLTSSRPVILSPLCLSRALCLFSVCFLSCGFCVVNTPYPMAIWRASF